MEEGERVGKERGKAAGGGDPRGWGGSRPRSAALGHLHRAAGPSGAPKQPFPPPFGLLLHKRVSPDVFGSFICSSRFTYGCVCA